MVCQAEFRGAAGRYQERPELKARYLRLISPLLSRCVRCRKHRGAQGKVKAKTRIQTGHEFSQDERRGERQDRPRPRTQRDERPRWRCDQGGSGCVPRRAGAAKIKPEVIELTAVSDQRVSSGPPTVQERSGGVDRYCARMTTINFLFDGIP